MDGVNPNFRGLIYPYRIFFFCENLLKRAVQTIACVSQSWHPVILNVWMKVLAFFFFLPSTVYVAKKTRSSCFKHLQMVMHQQLVPIQLSYCRGIKKTGRSLRSTANLPCRVREHFTWGKKGLLFLQRSAAVSSYRAWALPGRVGKNASVGQMFHWHESVESNRSPARLFISV